MLQMQTEKLDLAEKFKKIFHKHLANHYELLQLIENDFSQIMEENNSYLERREN